MPTNQPCSQRQQLGYRYRTMLLPPHLAVGLLLHLHVSIAAALSPAGSYTTGPIPLHNSGKLWYRIDLPTRTAHLALLVNDTSLPSASSPAWLGLGISEPTSGSMLGADIVTAEFTSSSTTACTLTDRHVPFAAYPLGEGAAGSPPVFPDADDCQDDGSWDLVRCERDAVKGEIILEVSRSLDAHDTQDREIVEGSNSVIHAYGGNFAYHGSNRSSTQVVFYEKGMKPGEPINAVPPLPDDVDGFVEIRATNYTVPDSTDTIYSCTSKLFELDGDSNRMIVAAEHFIESPKDMVHHLTLFLCSGEGYANKIAKTTECTDGNNNGIDGPGGNPEAGCSTFVYAYAKGMGRFIVPREAGFLVQKRRAFIVMETHYDNPGKIKGNVDKSGVRLYYTNTMRTNEAGSLLIGDGAGSRDDDIVQTGYEYEHTCPWQCTEKFGGNINIFGSFLHMHTTGRETYTNKFSKNGTFIETLNKVNFWSDNFQKYVFFDPPRSFRAGEQLQMTCVYDTTKRPNTIFGIATKNEMCMNFIGYWPLQRDPVTKNEINMCSFAREGNQSVTYCGDNANIDNSTIIRFPNPSLNDTVGAPTTFGDELGVCPLPVPSDDIIPTVEPTVTPVLVIEPEVSGAPSQTSELLQATPSSSPAPSLSIEASPATIAVNPPSPTNESSERACFPAFSTVVLKDGSSKRMEDLEIGDEVQVGPATFSPVFMFTHRTAKGKYNFVQIQAEQEISLSLTKGHFLYLNGRLAIASSVQVGDALTLADGSKALVSRVLLRTAKGLFNPQTIQGDIVVDGVITSTYTQIIDPEIAHGLLAPIRFLYLTFWSCDTFRTL